MKLSTPFAHFAPQVELAGLTPVKQSDSIYFAKVGSVKVELNCNSGTFKVFAGKSLPQVTDSLESSGWKVLSRNKGWSVLEIPEMMVSTSSEVVASFIKLVGDASTVAPLKAKVKTVKMSTVVKAVSKSFAEKQAIKARNLETIKAVAARLKGDEVPSFDSFDAVPERLDLRELGVM